MSKQNTSQIIQSYNNVSPLRYPGGKTRACKIIDNAISNYFDIKCFDTLVSPFFGGGSFEFYFQNKYNMKLIVNDKFTPLYNFWHQVKTNKNVLCEELRKINSVTKEQFINYRNTIMEVNDKVLVLHESLSQSDKVLHESTIARNHVLHESTIARNHVLPESLSQSDKVLPESLSQSDKVLPESLSQSNKVLPESLSQSDKVLPKAIQYFIINRCSFSGATLSGGFSEEASKKRYTPSSINKIELLDFTNIEIYNYDFKDFLNLFTNNFTNNKSLIFLDPPYYLEKKSKLYGNSGDMHEHFNHMMLFDLLKTKKNWIVTYNNCDIIRNLYKDYIILDVNWSYGMNKSKLSSEIIIISN